MNAHLASEKTKVFLLISKSNQLNELIAYLSKIATNFKFSKVKVFENYSIGKFLKNTLNSSIKYRWLPVRDVEAG